MGFKMRALYSLAALLMVGVVSGSNTTLNCPDGWVDDSHVGMGCLFYDWPERRSAPSYLHALQWCTEGPNLELLSSLYPGYGHLLEILTPEQHQYISEALNMLENGSSKQFYTAATDMNSETNWYWSHSKAVVEKFLWEPGWPQYGPYSFYGTIHSADAEQFRDMWTLRDVPEYWNGGSGYYAFCQYQP